MSLTYNDLPSHDICYKLTMTSFPTPQKNLAVYKFTNELDFYYKALDNERNKCLMEFGEADEETPGRYTIPDDKVPLFNAKMAEWCKIEIGVDPKITPIDLTFDDFTNCVYHKDKRFWLSAAEIVGFLEFVDKVRESEKK